MMLTIGDGFNLGLGFVFSLVTICLVLLIVCGLFGLVCAVFSTVVGGLVFNKRKPWTYEGDKK